VDKSVDSLSFDKVDKPQQYVEEEDTILVVNTDGEFTRATFKSIHQKPIKDCDVDWKVGIDNLYQFWREVDKDISPDERVVGVEIGNGYYEFPESKVFFKETSDVSGVGQTIADSLKDDGYRTLVDLIHASVDDLTDVSGVGRARAARIKDDVGNIERTKESSQNDSECPVSGCYTSIESKSDLYGHMISKHGFWSPSFESEL
jgi:hypothetical protein